MKNLDNIDRSVNSLGLVGNSLDGWGEFSHVDNGGKGSGNFGHGGRPGQVGGSGKGGKSSKAKDGGVGKDGLFHSRYEDAESFEYDGETFYVDDDKRGGTTKDGKKKMMFPDEILFATEQIVKSYQDSVKDGGKISSLGYQQAQQLAYNLELKARAMSDKRDADKAYSLIRDLDDILNDPRQIPD